VSGPANVFDVELEFDPDEREGYCRRWARIGPLVGGEKLGMSVYVLEDGEWICAYHYEWGSEEWLIVLDGTPTLRTPEGEHAMEPGDIVCFREGPEGAHNVRGPGRVAMLSTKRRVGMTEYPDSDKIAFWAAPGGVDYMLRRTPSLDYWDGEL
jgi:uncharacterized cupin superfamily protein